MTLQPVSQTKTAQNIRRLVNYCREGQASELLSLTLDKALSYEVDRCQEQWEQIRGDLTIFEQQYEMLSELFYHRFQTGQTDDRMDFVEWASLYQMGQNLIKRLDLLTTEPNRNSE
jgi:hypothetical protein